MIQPECKPLIEILNNKLFRIPEYQRHYSWQKDQRKDLFDDISKLKQQVDNNPDRYHFMATLVCLKTKEQEELGSTQLSVYDIVDGQQRITTLIVLLKAISKKLSDGSERDKKEAKDLDGLLVKEVDRRLILLQTNHDNLKILRSYLENGKAPQKGDLKTRADKNLYDAISECEKYVDTWNQDIIGLLKILKNKLCFIFQTVEDEGAVYTIFEVLNSRGLEVDCLDKTKSMLMGLLFEYSKSLGDKKSFDSHLHEIHTLWKEIYNTIGKKNIPGHEIIRFAATTLKFTTLDSDDKLSKTLSEKESRDFYKKHCSSADEPLQNKISKIYELSNRILKVTKSLNRLYGNKRLEAVTEISQARLLAISILLNENLSEENKDKLLKQWEKTTFRIYGMFRKDARFKVGDYVRSAKEILDDNITIERGIEIIKEIGADYPVEKAVKELRNSDCYNVWQKELRYFLYRYEEKLAEKQSGKIRNEIWEKIWNSKANDTIEHIMPEGGNTPNLEAWKGKTTSDEFEKVVHRLGNLLLLPPGANSSAKQKGFKEKKKIYKANRMYIMEDILKLNDWSEQDITSREEELLQWAKEEWKDL